MILLFQMHLTPPRKINRQCKGTFLNLPRATIPTTSPFNLTLVDQSTSPPSGVSGSDVFYAATTSSTSLIELYLQRPSGSAIQFSSGTAQQGATANFGQSFIPGGFQIKWGFETVNTGAVISYTAMSRGLTNFPNATIGVVITPTGSDFTQTSTDASLSASQFTIYTSKNALGVFWVAIGY